MDEIHNKKKKNRRARRTSVKWETKQFVRIASPVQLDQVVSVVRLPWTFFVTPMAYSGFATVIAKAATATEAAATTVFTFWQKVNFKKTNIIISPNRELSLPFWYHVTIKRCSCMNFSFSGVTVAAAAAAKKRKKQKKNVLF